MKLQEGGCGVTGTSSNFAGIRALGDAEQQADQQIAPQQPSELPGKFGRTSRYPRLVGRGLFHLGCLRSSSSHNSWLGIPHTVKNQGCRAITEQSTYRLTHNDLG